MKKTLSLIIVLALLASLSVNALAAVPIPLEPLWENAQRIDSSLHINNTSSYALACIEGFSNITLIEATLTVYRFINNEWIYINHTTNTTHLPILDLRVNFTALGGSSYKSILVVYLTNSEGVTESIQRARYANS